MTLSNRPAEGRPCPTGLGVTLSNRPAEGRPWSTGLGVTLSNRPRGDPALVRAAGGNREQTFSLDRVSKRAPAPLG